MILADSAIDFMLSWRSQAGAAATPPAAATTEIAMARTVLDLLIDGLPSLACLERSASPSPSLNCGNDCERQDGEVSSPKSIVMHGLLPDEAIVAAAVVTAASPIRTASIKSVHRMHWSITRASSRDCCKMEGQL
jgi:hypothetical protein